MRDSPCRLKKMRAHALYYERFAIHAHKINHVLFDESQLLLLVVVFQFSASPA
jgi:hypothetical protein